MAKIWVGKTGHLTTGHVLDCAKEPLDRALRSYDPLLYTRWNPKKLGGWGAWELRRRPEHKTLTEIVEFKGQIIFRIEYKELDIVAHVCDIPFLNYSILEKVKKMDTWATSDKGKDWAKELEYREAKHSMAVEDKAYKDLAYNIKQNKKAFRDFREAILSGTNPGQIADHWDKK